MKAGKSCLLSLSGAIHSLKYGSYTKQKAFSERRLFRSNNLIGLLIQVGFYSSFDASTV